MAGGFVAGGVDDALTTEFEFTNRPESVRAQEVVEDRIRGPRRVTEFIVVRSERLVVDDFSYRAFVERLTDRLALLQPDTVEGFTTFYATGDPALVSEDRHAMLIPATMAGTFDDATDRVGELHDALDAAAEEPAFDLFVAGQATISDDFRAISEEDLRTGELFGLPIAILVLITVFGALVAALVPVLLAIAAIVVAIGLVSLLGAVTEFSFFVVNMITMMGLAVGIDYSLFIVSRYREERAHGVPRDAAIERTGATASRAVLFSGGTVVFALLGMLLIPSTVFRSLGVGAILVVSLAVLAALTLLPAILRLLGDRVNRLQVPFHRPSASKVDLSGGFWNWATGNVMRRPVVSVLLAAGVLVAAALSLFDMRTGFSGVSTMPDDTRSKRAFEVLLRDFSAGLAEPVEIVIDGPFDGAALQSGIAELRARLDADPRFGPAGPLEAGDQRDAALITVPLAIDAATDEAADAVRDLRNDYVPASFDGDGTTILVGGMTAFAVDFFAVNRTYTPIVFAFVLALSFVLLTMVFRSLVVPLKAILLNLLSVGAAYGLVVLVFQKGYGAGVLGFQQVDVIEAWLPLFLFSILFGLSMDYHVFLLSRIRERYNETGHNTEAVAFGVRTTAGIITGAALIMVAVFGAFAAGDLTSLQQMGFGLAVAVFIDATIVRTVLVPATMRLLGRANWYFPAWLHWIPRLGIGEGPLEPAREIDLRDGERVIDVREVGTRRRD